VFYVPAEVFDLYIHLHLNANVSAVKALGIPGERERDSGMMPNADPG
jgi:hypothetical protein